MGQIRVGQKSPKTVDMGGFTILPDNGANTENKQKLTADEKARIVNNIMQLPKDEIVPALRKNGFNDIADIAEAEMKKADEDAAKAVARENRLNEILALPVDEQLPLLLEEGYNEEAKELSERLAKEDGDKGDGSETENDQDETGDETGDGSETETSEEKKKRGGRTKKESK